MRIVFLILVLSKCGSCVLVVRPRNTAVVAGESIVLECRTENNSYVREWSFQRISYDHIPTPRKPNSEPEKIFSHWSKPFTITPKFPHFSATVDAFGSGILFSRGSSLDDAGIYICVVEVDNNIVKYSAEVIVLQSKPHCEASFRDGDWFANEDQISLRCGLSFRGSQVPSIQWRHHKNRKGMEKDGEVILDGIASNVIAGSNVTSTLRIIVTPSKNNSFYAGTIVFLWHNVTSLPEKFVADNAPNYSYAWNSPAIQVLSKEEQKNETPLNWTLMPVTVWNNKGLTNWYTISLTLFVAVVGIILLMAIVVTILCFRMRRKKSLDVGNSAISASVVPKTNTATQDLATSSIPVVYEYVEDDYEQIGKGDQYILPFTRQPIPPGQYTLPWTRQSNQQTSVSSPGYIELSASSPYLCLFQHDQSSDQRTTRLCSESSCGSQVETPLLQIAREAQRLPLEAAYLALAPYASSEANRTPAN